jgi:NarL family two-component system response regulator YdfI
VATTSAVRRARLESIVRSHAEFHLAGSFGAMASLVSFAHSTELDVIVIDSDSIRDSLLGPISDAAIVLLTEISDARSISRLLRSGVRAILSRESDADDILSAIYAAYDGLVLLSTPIAESLTAVYGDQSLEVVDEVSEEITSRETEVPRMLAEGAVNKEIAARLGISEHTVKFHISSILDKLGRSFRLLEVRHSWSTEHRPLFWPRSLFSGLERGNRCSRCHSKSLPEKFDEGAWLPIADLGRNRFYRTSCNQQLYSFHRTHLPSPHRRTRFSTRM